ncbi:MAG: roadblock/LC7 domain-containing protein [Candidatus Nanohalobium sp.]
MGQDKLEQLLDGNVDEVRSAIRDEDSLDYQKLKELEKEGKDRKTIKKFLDKRIEDSSNEEKEEASASEESEQEEPEEDEEDEVSENEDSGSEDEEDSEASQDQEEESDDSTGGMAEKLQGPLEDLESVGSIRGAAVVRRDGLLIASNLGKDIEDDQVGAMTASIVGSGETASGSLNMGDVDEVTVESEEGLLIATGAGEEGILAVLADPDVNMGLVKVEIEDAVKKTKKVL